MSKTRVFIYGSCVSRDTFEHFDPEQFELVEYVARQSVLSAYTKPVELMAPPTLESRFQQRMVTGDFSSSLRSLLSTHGSATDLVLVDLTDERLGAYLLPDGSMVTRSVELIESGAEQHLPQGTQHIAFGTQQHFEYWSTAMNYIGERFQHYMPQATVVLLDLAWAEWSESGAQTPDSFGVSAAQANPVFRSYVDVAAQALGAHVVSMEPSEVMSGPHHPWGEAPFHYSENVYLNVVKRLTGTEGRVLWGPGANRTMTADLPLQSAGGTPASGSRTVVAEGAVTSGSVQAAPAAQLQRITGGPDFLIAGAHRGGTLWLHKQLNAHPNVFMASSKASNFFNSAKRVTSKDQTKKYVAEFSKATDTQLRGERSVLYFWQGLDRGFSPKREDTARNVGMALPSDVPILLSLRDPVTRAISAYWNYVSGGQMDTAATIFQSEPGTGVLDLGFYRRHYEAWERAVGSDRLHVLLYDDLVTDPAGYLRQALKALNLGEPAGYWDKVGLKRRENHRPWVVPLRRRGQVKAVEVGALLEIYREDIEFIEHVTNRKLDGWRDLSRLNAYNIPK